MATRSAFDTTGQAYVRGASAEDSFADALKARYPGREIRPANEMEEKREHWDWKLCMGTSCESASSIKYEVKGVRKLQMSDAAPQDKFFPVEFRSVGGFPGWVYGKANWIAFQTLGDDWILVKPADLLAMATQKIIAKANQLGIEITSIEEALENSYLRAANSREALYRIYGRAGRNDALTWVRKEDILALPHEYWKPGETATISEPATIRVTPKRGAMGPGGKQLWTSEVSVWQGRKLIQSVPLQGRWDDMKVNEILKASIPQDKWTAEAIIQQLKTNPRFTGQQQPSGTTEGFKEWVIWHEKTIR